MSSDSDGDETNSLLLPQGRPVDISIQLNPERKTDSFLEPVETYFPSVTAVYETSEGSDVEVVDSIPSPNPAKRKALEEWNQIAHLDQFLEHVYEYYREGGYRPLVLGMVSGLAKLAFLIVFTTFLVYFVDWSFMGRPATASDHPQLWKLVSLFNFFQNISLFGLVCIIVFGCFWALQAGRVVSRIPRYGQIWRFYHDLLGMRDRDLREVVDFRVICNRIRRLNEQHCIAHSSLDAGSICGQIMRRENYLIALFSRHLLPLDRTFLSTKGGKGLFGVLDGDSQLLTKVLEWNIVFAVLGFSFEGERGGLRSTFLKMTQKDRLTEELQRRFRVLAVANLVLAPFILVSFVVYFFFRYGEEIYRNPSTVGERQYSPFARWVLREYNELEHLLDRRLAASYKPATKYLAAFEDIRWTSLAKFVAFIAGSVMLVLLIVSGVKEELLMHFELSKGKSIIWYLGLFGVLLAVARSAIPDRRRLLRHDRQSLLRQTAFHLHYTPESWQKHPEGKQSRQLLASLLVPRYVLFLRELVGLLLNPLILYCSLPEAAGGIIDFLRENSIKTGSGYVCSLSVFGEGPKEDGNEPLTALADDEKMTRSMIAFRALYSRQPSEAARRPEWAVEDFQLDKAASAISSFYQARPACI